MLCGNAVNFVEQQSQNQIICLNKTWSPFRCFTIKFWCVWTAVKITQWLLSHLPIVAPRAENSGSPWQFFHCCRSAYFQDGDHRPPNTLTIYILCFKINWLCVSIFWKNYIELKKSWNCGLEINIALVAKLEVDHLVIFTWVSYKRDVKIFM